MAGRKSTAMMEMAIGATIIAGVIVLIAMLMFWGNSSSLLSSHYRVVVNMTNVGGLKEGAPVKMGGYQIGRVSTIQIRPGGTDMEIVLDIDDNRSLPKGSTAKVATAGLVGDAFMEIIPGTSSEMIRHSTTVAEAERLDSAPLPDLSELLTKVNDFGEQLTILTNNLNDIVGDVQFRKSVKSLVGNIDAASYQANLILQRGQSVVDNIEKASQNVEQLSETLRKSLEEVTMDVEKVTDAALEIADTAKDTISTVKQTVDGARTAIDKVSTTVENIDGAVTEARQAMKSTVGNPKFAEDLTATIANIQNVTSLLKERRETIDQLLVNVNELTVTLRGVSTDVKGITGAIDPQTIPTALKSMTGAIDEMTGTVNMIKKEPVLALSINKAADRIVKIKFDEMSKQHIRSADDVLNEVNRWIRENMDKGYFHDPSYPYEKRPYVITE